MRMDFGQGADVRNVILQHFVNIIEGKVELKINGISVDFSNYRWIKVQLFFCKIKLSNV